MITIEQCRAARGLLDWTQKDLADAAGLSKTAINNFEKRHSDIKHDSLRAIRMAFESLDVEFIGEYGVTRKTDSTKIIRGSLTGDFILKDILRTMEEIPGGDILLLNASRKFHEHEAGRNTMTALTMEQLEKLDLTWRCLCPEGEIDGFAKRHDYRVLPQTMFDLARPTIIYGRKLCFELSGQSLSVLVDSKDAGQDERKRFEYLWSIAKKQAGSSGKTAITSQAQGS